MDVSGGWTRGGGIVDAETSRVSIIQKVREFVCFGFIADGSPGGLEGCRDG